MLAAVIHAMCTGLLKQIIFVEYKTRTEIMEILQEKQVSFCERQVQKLFERYTVLLQADHENDMKERFQHEQTWCISM